MAFLERNANRGSISSELELSNSVMIDNLGANTNSNNFNHQQMSTGGDDQWSANANAGTNDKKATISMWCKRTHLSQGSGHGEYQRLFQFTTGGTATALYFNQDDLKMYDDNTSASLVTNRKFRDCSAWYHIVLAMDSTQSTAADRVKIYVNGVQETSFSTEDYGNQNAVLGMFSNSAVTFYLACAGSQNSGYAFDGYITEFHFVDGEQKDADDFGKIDDNGVWVPKPYTGSHGILGCHYNFEDTSNNRFNDESGNGNYMDNRGGSYEGVIATDTPTNNFCTLNFANRTNGNIRTQAGGTEATTDGGSGWCGMVATMFVGAGKWYWEVLYEDDGDADDVHIGIAAANDPWFPARQVSGGYYLGNVETGGAMGWDLDSGTNYNQNGSWGNPSRGDKLMVAYDADNYKLYYGINGTWGNSADPANGTGSVTAIESYWMSGINNALDFVAPAVSIYQGNRVRSFNFGGVNTWTIASGNADANGYGNFEYAPPTGFYALCTKNLAQYGG